MKVLIAEDTNSKADEIKELIMLFWSNPSVNFVRSFDVAQTVKHIHETSFDLIVIDLMMPHRIGDDDEPSDVSMELLGYINDSKNNYASRVIAITQFSHLAEENEREFRQSGIITINYNTSDNSWKEQFKATLKSIKFKMTVDFVIVCALEKERQGYKSTDVEFLHNFVLAGMDCTYMKIGNRLGVCILSPKVGPIDAAVTSSKAIQRFEPKLICMSGICAGIPENVKLGESILVEEVWDHQSGKFNKGGLTPTIYQTSMCNSDAVVICSSVKDDGELINKVSSLAKLLGVESCELVRGPMVTGSTVIAEVSKRDEIKAQQRKIMGIDMEMVSVYRSAELNFNHIKVFGIKTVIDLADGDKNDTYHEYGCQVSALYTVKAIETLIENIE